MSVSHCQEIVRVSELSPSNLDAWLSLYEALPNARFYHHPNWLRTVDNHLLPGQISVALLFEDAHLIMLIPLICPGQNRRPQHPSHDHLSLNDVLVHPSLSTSKFFTLFNTLLKKVDCGHHDWQAWNVPQISDLIGLISPEASVNEQMQATTDSTSKNPYLTLRPDEHFWTLRYIRNSAWFNCSDQQRAPQGKLRRNLRRLRTRLNAQGAVRTEGVTGKRSLILAYETFLRVEASGWKGCNEAGTAIVADAELRQFYGSLLELDCSDFRPQINLLWVDDTCAAVQFGVRTGDCLSLLKIGYNEAFAAFSPGSLLLEDVLEATAINGLTTVSLVTAPGWADRWHPQTMPVWHVTRFNKSPAGHALRHLHSFKNTAKSRLRQAIRA